MSNTLGLDDDLEPNEVVRELERVFDINFSNEETERLSNVGQLHDLLMEKIPPADTDRKCASAMAFYRVRGALRRLGFGERLTPASDIRAFGRGRAKSNLRNLENETSLRMPEAASTRIGELASLCGLILALGAVFAVQPGVASAVLGVVVGLLVAMIVLHVDPGKLPANCETLGQLAAMVAAKNYGRLVKEGARHRSEDIWENLIEALSHHALPKSKITRETFFLQKQLKNRWAWSRAIGDDVG